MNYNDFFISKKNSQPLNKEQFNYYLEKYHNGDLEAKNILIEHNIGLVFSRLHQRFNRLSQDDKQELLCVGIEALIKALSSFDLSYNIAFSSYAVPCIDNTILQFIEKDKKHCNNFSLEDLVYTSKDGDEIKVGDILSDENIDLEANYEQKESTSLIRKLIDTLPSPDREIIILYFGFDGSRVYKQSELADMYNCSQTNIARIVQKNVDILKKELYKQGIIETTRKCSSTYKSDVPSKISIYQYMKLQFERIINQFKNYSNVQILQALQIYISDLPKICNEILLLSFNTDEKYTQEKMAVKLNCSRWSISDNIKKINIKLNSKSLFEELSLILSQMTSEVKILKMHDEQTSKKDTIFQEESNTDSHFSLTNFELLKDNIKKNSLFNNSLFEQAFLKFDNKMQAIIILRLNNYDLDEISKIIDIDVKDILYINDVIRNFLLTYKDIVNSYIESSIKLVLAPKNKHIK